MRAQSLICVPAFLCVAVCVQAPWSSSSTGTHSFPIIPCSLWARTQSHIPACLLLIMVWLQGRINLQNIAGNLLVYTIMPQNINFTCILFTYLIHTACSTHLHSGHVDQQNVSCTGEYSSFNKIFAQKGNLGLWSRSLV